jgi:hypothetical protein
VPETIQPSETQEEIKNRIEEKKKIDAEKEKYIVI